MTVAATAPVSPPVASPPAASPSDPEPPAADRTTDPSATHAAARTDHEAAVARWRRWDDALAAIRGLTFLVAVGVAVGWAVDACSGWWLLIPAVAFAGLCLVHEGVAARQAHAAAAVSHHDHARLRINGGLPPDADAGADLLPPDCPHAADLDLFGDAGLFARFSCARTAEGRSTLAAWLLAPAEPSEVRDRQRVAAALAGDVTLRERLALLPGDPPTRHGDAAPVPPPRPVPAAVRVAAVAFGFLALFGLGWWLIAAGTVGVLLAAVGGQGALLGLYRDRVSSAGAYAERTGGGVRLLSGVLGLLERCDSPAVADLRERLTAGGTIEAPSKAVARLATYARRLEASRNNQFVAMASAVFALPLFHSHAIARWAETHGGRLADWAAVAGRFEALCSLARWRFEHPRFAVPRYGVEEGAARFVGVGLGHPLLPEGECVRNDVALATGDAPGAPDAPALLLVSGSNMSGKSTLLRAVGVNATLAGAGAAVCAESLSLSPCRVRSVMRVTDSLADGKSLFFESVRRLGDVLEDAQSASPQDGPPILFLLDEILQGTNSADRRTGAEAVVRTLLDRGAFGLVTTHDLALTEVADELDERAANVHFRDQLSGGRMTFDHRLRPGVVPRSNALELMRLVGIVPRED